MTQLSAIRGHKQHTPYDMIRILLVVNIKVSTIFVLIMVLKETTTGKILT